MRMMLIMAGAAVVAAAAFATPTRQAKAENYPWCVVYGGLEGGGTETCTFTSYAQCMQTGGPGTGGTCVENPYYQPEGERRPPRRRPHR